MILSIQVMLVSQWKSGSSCFRRQTRKGKESRLPFSSFFSGVWAVSFCECRCFHPTKIASKKKNMEKFQELDVSWEKQGTVDDTISAVFLKKGSSSHPTVACLQWRAAWYASNIHLLGWIDWIRLLLMLSRWNNSRPHLEKNRSYLRCCWRECSFFPRCDIFFS